MAAKAQQGFSIALLVISRDKKDGMGMASHRQPAP
jgi:hypothetical protein